MLAGAWLIGRVAGEDGRRWVELGLIAAVVVNAVIAIAQTTFNLNRINLELTLGRPAALMGNPVYLGILLGGGFWLVVQRARHSLPQAVVLTLLVATAIQA